MKIEVELKPLCVFIWGNEGHVESTRYWLVLKKMSENWDENLIDW